MKRSLTILSKGAVCLLALAAVAMCVILLPELAREAVVEDPAMVGLTYPFFAMAYGLTIPFFIALYQTYKLLNYVEQDRAFSQLSVQALQNIKRCTVVFGVLAIVGGVAGNMFITNIAPDQDVSFTLMLVLGCLLAFMAGVIATFIAVLQRLLQEALEMQKENELTV